MKRQLTLVALLIACLAVASAQDKHVTVVGEGAVVTMPDRAVVTIKVVAREDKPLDALETMNKNFKKMLEPLKIAGLESKNLVISGYAIEPFRYREEKDTRMEYEATATVKVTVANVNRVGDVLDKAFNAGATLFCDPAYFTSQEDQLEGQALDKAMTDAKAKAAKIAEGLGGAVGKPLRAQVTYTITPLAVNDGKADVFALAASTKSPVLAPFQLSVSAKIEVDFELVGN